MQLLIVMDDPVIEFAVVVPEGQTHEQVKERVAHHRDEAIKTYPDDWTYSGVSLALANEGYTIIGGNALDEICFQ